MKARLAWTVIALLAPLLGSAAAAPLPIERIRLPPGFRIEVCTDGVPGARSLALAPSGTLFVGTRGEGKVYALPDANRDCRPDQVIVLASGKNSPNGVALRNGALYVAEIDRVWRIDDVEKRLQRPAAPVAVGAPFPKDEHHGWKFIAFGPDDRLYVPIGAPCNVCNAGDPYGAILRMKPDGSGREVFARGVRNTVGFDWHPLTQELWFTDNGRDRLGDDLPADELNRAPKPGLHFGFPFCHAGDLADPEFGQRRPCSDFTPPARKLGPHVAALGMRFYTGSSFPKEYRHQIFVAEHGSWNRSTRIGYRISLVRLAGSRIRSYETFAEGWLDGKSVWGRPVDLAVTADGALLVSDDKAGAIYRISYVR